MTLEQKLQEFDEKFGKDPENPEDYTSIGRYAGCDDCHCNKLLRQEHREFVKSVHSSAVEETRSTILKGIEEIRQKGLTGLAEKLLESPLGHDVFWEKRMEGFNKALDDLLSTLQTNKVEE